MPELTPADVYSAPSATKIASRSIRTVGYRSASSSKNCQWVVARRPSSRPASASTKAPTHTLTTRRLRAAASLTAASRSARPIASGQVQVPGTIMVSTGPATSAADASTPMRKPELLITSAPSGDTIRTR